MFSANTSQVAAGAVNYIEDVFSTYLYTGNGSTQTITNGIDLSTKGGLLWMKSRSAVAGHMLYDTASNATLRSDSTSANSGYYPTYINPTSSGFFLDASAGGGFNTNAVTYASWTFREQAKFFDVVTYTGNGTNGRTVAHNLGSAPGCIIIKRTSATGPWYTWHRSLTADKVIYLNTTAAQADPPYGAGSWISSDSTTVTFPNASIADVNNNGYDYVMYVFAHNAGGFGLTGTDNVISCGSFTTDGSSNATITLGYEPQWVLTKRSDSSGAWGLYDTMRGWSYSAQNYLLPNDSGAEGTINSTNFKPTATGFTVGSPYDSSATYIYIAIRRGPMKVPTSGTSVFSPNFTSSATTPLTVTTNFPVDLSILRYTSGSANYDFDRLRGASSTTGKYLITNSTAAEGTSTTYTVGMQSNTAVIDYGFLAGDTTPKIYWNFQRAPSFFDEVCYTGTGSARTVTHNLGVAPEMMIVKARVTVGGVDRAWTVYSANLNNTSFLRLNQTDSAFTGNTTTWNSTSPTSSVFTVGTANEVNGSGATYVAYLFATCAGVSKVGSYTGTGATQTISCGFAGGARWVMIKRTDGVGGDWYVWDTARGMVAGTDPNLQLNTTNAETNTNSIYTTTGGFQIVSTAAGINASGGSYIFLAIA